MRYSALTLFFATILVLLPVSVAAAPSDNTIYLNSRDVPYRMVRRRAQGLSPMAPVMINRRVSDKHDARGLLSGLFGGDKGNDATPVNAGTGNNTTDPGTGGTTTNNSTTTTNDPSGSTNTTDTGNTNKNPQNPNNPDNGAASVSSQAVSSVAAATQSTPSASSTSSAATASTPSPTATLNLSFLPTTTGSFTDPFASSSTATGSATDAANNVVAPGVENKSAFSHTTIVILIVIASCVAAAAIIWTAIRKWKFSPSRQFEDRLQRIDWEPSNEHGNQLSAGLGGGFRHGSSTREMSERRSSHGSFGSSDRNHPDDGASTAANVAPDLPAHDFTAGPAAPGATYANLARGTSLNRGASLNRGNTSVTRGPSYGRAYYGGYGTQQPANNFGYGY